MSEENTQTPLPSLSITDLNTALQVIDLAAKRGAFQASELETVGQVFNRINAFVASHQKQDSEGSDTTSDKES